MSNKTLADAKATYEAWKEVQTGSYMEQVLEHAIVKDIVPALILMVERNTRPAGFEKGEAGDDTQS